MAEVQDRWTEQDSRDFLDLAEVAVPGRGEQMDVLVSLIPARKEETFAVADLGCGEGLLSERILGAFPQARIVAFDGSDLMLERAAQRVGERVQLQPFELKSEAWLDELPSPLRCVVTSLSLHHVDGEAKKRLFSAIAERLEPGGALLIADIVAPASDTARRSFSALYDEITRRQSLAVTGSLEAFETLQKEGWNAFALEEPVPGEMPSRLFDQLRWLEEAGFRMVDCFWMRAGHAIYGGYK